MLKKSVIENWGKRSLPLRQSLLVAAPALSLLPLSLPDPALTSFSEEERLTRWTPSTRRRLEITLATLSWLVVQPTSSMAGDCTAARSGSLTPPSAAALGVTVARIDVSQASAGIVRATSCSAWLQSKRLEARLRTVSLRLSRRAVNAVYACRACASLADACACAWTSTQLLATVGDRAAGERVRSAGDDHHREEAEKDVGADARHRRLRSGSGRARRPG